MTTTGKRGTPLRLLTSNAGYTLVEGLIVTVIIVILAIALVYATGAFTDVKGEELEKHHVSTAAAALLVDQGLGAIPEPICVTPEDKGLLEPYLEQQLKNDWVVNVDGQVLSGSALLFSTEFDDMDRLNTLQGDWEARFGMLRPGSDVCRHELAFDDSGWDDFEMSVTVTLESTAGAYGIYYRCDETPNVTGYCFEYYADSDGGAFLVRPVCNGRDEPPIATCPMESGFFCSQLGSAHDIGLSVQGDHHLVTVDGEKVLEFSDSSFTQGVCGLRTRQDSDARFHAVIVTGF